MTSGIDILNSREPGRALTYDGDNRVIGIISDSDVRTPRDSTSINAAEAASRPRSTGRLKWVM